MLTITWTCEKLGHVNSSTLTVFSDRHDSGSGSEPWCFLLNQPAITPVSAEPKLENIPPRYSGGSKLNTSKMADHSDCLQAFNEGRFQIGFVNGNRTLPA